MRNDLILNNNAEPMSERELNEYLNILQIKPLCVKYIKYLAVVLYKFENKEFMSFIYKQGNRINSTRSGSISRRPISEMVMSWGVNQDENITVASIVFNDANIIYNAEKVKLIINGTKEYFGIIDDIYKDAVILYLGNEDVEKLNITSIFLYYKDGNTLQLR